MRTLQECADGKLSDKGQARPCGQSLAQIYEPYMAPMRTRPRGLVCELGVSGGGSLSMWSEYFGWPVLGVDVQANCTQYIDHKREIDVLVAGQDAPEVHDAVKARGGADVILDDAAHLTELMVRSFSLLWPLVKPGGLYIIEDTLLTYVRDIAAEVKAGGWGGMDACKVKLENNRQDIEKLLASLASSIDTANIENGVASYHVHPQTIIIRKIGNVTTG